jgi:nitroreductase
MDVLDAIASKHALRNFSDRPVPEDDIRAIVNAGRRAPSWFNKQQWRYIVVRDADTKEYLSITGRSTWHAAGAAFVIVMCIPQENEQTRFNYFDLGQSAGYMQLAAHSLGVGSSLGTIYQPERVADIVKLPADWWSPLLLSMGYPEDSAPRPPKAGGRLPLGEILRWEQW